MVIMMNRNLGVDFEITMTKTILLMGIVWRENRNGVLSKSTNN